MPPGTDAAGAAAPGADRNWARMAEARRNRAALVEAAASAFVSDGSSVPLETIARRAGVGIGTLYRHFPRRENLVEAVYEDHVERLHRAAVDLLAAHPAVDALRSWVAVFLDWAVTKHGMAEALGALMASGGLDGSVMRGNLVAVVSLFLDAGRADGSLRTDADPDVVAALFASVIGLAGRRDERADAGQMLDIVVDGLRGPGVSGAGIPLT